MVNCTDCGRSFNSEAALHAHCRDKEDHPYCDDCERLFVSFAALNQHRNMSSRHTNFSDDSESDWDDSGSDSDETYCNSCDRHFVSNESLNAHLSASSKHNWCFECSRDFQSFTALQQHQASRVHKARTLNCPMCDKKFAIPSAIAFHIESGCHGVNRYQVTAAVHSLEAAGTISLTKRIEGRGISATRAITHNSATEMAFNGAAYECYFCHKTFRTLDSLNAHLSSPAHDADEFCCPNKKCNRRYKLVSGLIQHIETEVCGLARFQEVEDFAEVLSTQFAGLLTI